MSDQAYCTDIYNGSTLRIIEFRCARAAARRGTGRASGHMIVFPRTPVRITQQGHQPVVSDSNTVMFYNQGCEYTRQMLVEEGDCCEAFVIRPDVLIDAIAEYDPAVLDRPDHPFTASHGWSSPSAYLVQRKIYHHVRGNDIADPVGVEETFFGVLGEIVADAHRARGIPRKRAGTAKAHRERAEETKAVLARHFAQQIALNDLADMIHVSPFHLCRIFKQHTGIPIHRYLLRLRLRDSLEQIADTAGDISRLAFSLGFSSYDHFSRGFQREFGMTPKVAQRRMNRGNLREMSKILGVRALPNSL